MAKNSSVAEIQAVFQQALAFHRNGLLVQAASLYERVLKFQPKHIDSLNLLAQLAFQAKNYQRAFELLDKARQANPGIAASHSNIGLVLQSLNKLDEALACYDKALALKPDYSDAHNNRGNVLKDLKRPDEALTCYDKALALNPGFPEAYNNRGNALLDLKRPVEALVSYNQAISLKPDYAQAHCNAGNALVDLKRLDEALASYDKALGFDPGYAVAHNNRGNVLQVFKRLDEALACYDKALAFAPDYAIAYNNRGNVLKALRRHDEALANYDKALAFKPDYAEALNNRGNALVEMRRLDDALVCYEKTLVLESNYEFLLGTLIHTKMKLCDWAGFPEILNAYELAISRAELVTVPFPVVGLLDSPELQQQASRIYINAKYPKSQSLGEIPKRADGQKIRIGYYSADFQNHATSYLMAQLFEVYDAEKFELYGFSFGPDIQDEMRHRLSCAFDKFLDVRDKSDREIALISRDLSIDIAVDLKGFTQDSRVGIFAERCAPIQVNYLGYPGTMGADYIDYVIADKTVISDDSEPCFSEKVVYLPSSYQVNDARRKISDRIFSRQDLGLPESGFVYCCFNNSYKILPTVFDCWMRILKAVEGSVIWLLEDNATAAMNLRKEAEARGVDGSRLVFAKRMPLDEHLARHRMADLFIDTLPYNAHTTASDALWAGLPVLTCMGKSFASRVAASLLNAIALPELVTHSQDEYEAAAVDLAIDIKKLAGIKSKLDHNKFTAPLFDAELFAKHIESAYQSMYLRHQSGMPPESFVVRS